jgi:hypothetical protein
VKKKLSKKKIAELEAQRMPEKDREAFLKLLDDIVHNPNHPIITILSCFNGQHGK